MKTKRKYEGKELLFDSKDLFDVRKHKSKKLLKMIGQNRSYLSPSGVKFWWDHPFQWVPQEDVAELLAQSVPYFQHATIEEVEDYYLND